MYVPQADVFQTVWERLIALLQSKRFIASIVALLMTLFGVQFGLDEELATSIVTAIVALVVGDSIRPIQDLLKSRRMWAFIGSVVAVIVVELGVDISPDIIQQVILVIAAWIVGDSWRVTLKKRKMLK